jgi:hypothetical protein
LGWGAGRINPKQKTPLESCAESLIFMSIVIGDWHDRCRHDLGWDMQLITIVAWIRL